jgi:D-amino-acid dehydrogenase
VRVVILGAGVVGVTTAYELQKDGHEVVVIEQHDGAADETSAGNAGLIAPGHSYTWASPKAPGILMKSLYRNDQALRFKPRLEPDLYRWSLQFLRNCTPERSRTNTLRKLALCSYSQQRLHQVVKETGVAYDGIAAGLLYVYRDPASFEGGVAHMGILQEGGQRMEVLDVDRTIEIEPALAAARESIAGSIFCPDDESGDCRMFSRNLVDWLTGKGVEFRWSTKVLGFSTSGDRVENVRTSRGPVQGDAYVVAVGSSVARLTRELGLRLPVYPIKGYSATVPIVEGNEPPEHGGVEENHLVAWAKFGDRLRLTSTAEFAGYDTSFKPSDFEAMLDVARKLLPNAADYSQPSYWAGLRPMTPEGTPILGHGKQRNLWVNAGHGHMGWTMSCGTARIMADMIEGQPTEIDITGMALAA